MTAERLHTHTHTHANHRFVEHEMRDCAITRVCTLLICGTSLLMRMYVSCLQTLRRAPKNRASPAKRGANLIYCLQKTYIIAENEVVKIRDYVNQSRNGIGRNT